MTLPIITRLKLFCIEMIVKHSNVFAFKNRTNLHEAYKTSRPKNAVKILMDLLSSLIKVEYNRKRFLLEISVTILENQIIVAGNIKVNAKRSSSFNKGCFVSTPLDLVCIVCDCEARLNELKSQVEQRYFPICKK